jgi:hypothetical protein
MTSPRWLAKSLRRKIFPVTARDLSVCPKCQRARKPGEDSCARCGLLVTRWEGFQLTLPSLPPVDAAWTRLASEWEDEAAHKRFLELAAQHDGLDVAAALYQKAQRDRPGDARAEDGVKRAATLAQHLYKARADAERAQAPLQGQRLLRVVSAIVALVAAVIAFWLFSKRP